MSQKRLVRILLAIKKNLPWVKRIGTYANIKALKKKSVEELMELKKLGIKIVYIGLETGDDVTLKAINKGYTAEEYITQAAKVRAAGIK